MCKKGLYLDNCCNPVCSQILDLLRNCNATYKLGHLLCRSRAPDFLLDILQRQGTSQAMPWLADLVESSEGSLSQLPVQVWRRREKVMP